MNKLEKDFLKKNGKHFKKMKDIDSVAFFVYALNQCNEFQDYLFYSELVEHYYFLDFQGEELEAEELAQMKEYYSFFFELDFRYSFLLKIHGQILDSSNGFYYHSNERIPLLLMIIEMHPNFNAAKAILKEIKELK